MAASVGRYGGDYSPAQPRLEPGIGPLFAGLSRLRATAGLTWGSRACYLSGKCPTGMGTIPSRLKFPAARPIPLPRWHTAEDPSAGRCVSVL